MPENYGSVGRRIALNVVVLPGDHSTHDPLFELEGGPGIAVSDTIAFYAVDGALYRANRDHVFIDMRGTGASHPMRCPEIEAYDRGDIWSPMYPPELVAACAQALSADADLSQYNTANAVRDLDAVRAALGYNRIALNALSYGTGLALGYIAEHPDRVSAAILTGTAPASATPPRFHAPAAQKALEQLFALCADEAACDAAFPDPSGDLNRVLASLPPERAEIFAERLRARLYGPQGARGALLWLHRAAAGEIDTPSGAAPAIVDGLYLSVTCAESFPAFDLESARTAARATIFGDYRLRRQSAACAAWPVTAAEPPAPHARLDVPVLFVSGSLDPVTPPAWARETLTLFPNGRHIVIEGGAHIVDGLSALDTCYDPTMVRFLDSGDAHNLDTSCFADVQPPAFATETH